MLPLTATILVNANVATKDESLESKNDNLASFYQVSEKYSKISTPQLAGSDSLSDLTLKVQNESPKSKARIEDVVFNAKQIEAIKVIDKNTSNGDSGSIKIDTGVKDGSTKPDEKKFDKMTKDYPINDMLPYILQRDPKTAAFIVAIAKKESNWGKVAPHHNGRDCYNYWGFKDSRFETVLGGHSCFPSAEKAIETVGNRIEKLVKKGIDTPSKFVIWKCGSACKSDGNASKWVSDVGMYYNKLALASGGSNVK